MHRNTGVMLISIALGSVAGVISYAPEAIAQSANDGAALIRFQRGRDLFVAHNYEDALPEFRAAVTLVPSPNTRLYIARCLHNLNRNAEAVIEYQRAAAEAADRATSEPRYATTRDTARSESAQLEPLLGRLTIHVPNAPQGIAVTAAGNAVPSALFDVPSPTDPTTIEVVATAPGYLPFRGSATVTSGGTAELTVALRPDPNAHREEVATTASHAPPAPVGPRMVTVRQGGGVRMAGIAVAAVGLVGGAVTFSVLGSMASTRFNELHTQCPNGCPEMETRIAEGERDQLIANVALGAGAALLVAGGVMAIVGGPHDVLMPMRDHARRESRPAWSVWGAPSAGSGGMGGIAGMF